MFLNLKIFFNAARQKVYLRTKYVFIQKTNVGLLTCFLYLFINNTAKPNFVFSLEQDETLYTHFLK